jgi:hypothetical protein
LTARDALQGLRFLEYLGPDGLPKVFINLYSGDLVDETAQAYQPLLPGVLLANPIRTARLLVELSRYQISSDAPRDLTRLPKNAFGSSDSGNWLNDMGSINPVKGVQILVAMDALPENELAMAQFFSRALALAYEPRGRVFLNRLIRAKGSRWVEDGYARTLTDWLPDHGDYYFRFADPLSKSIQRMPPRLGVKIKDALAAKGIAWEDVRAVGENYGRVDAHSSINFIVRRTYVNWTMIWIP